MIPVENPAPERSRQENVCRRIPGVLVCGAGPVGLCAACILRLKGEKVTVAERRSWQQLGKTALDEPSFNVTLVDRSMEFLASMGTPVDDLAIVLVARQFWRNDRVSIHPYGLRDGDRLHSIPRSSLVHRLFERAQRLGVEFLPSTRVVRLDARRGHLLAEFSDGGTFGITANHILVADGANSRLREDMARQADTNYSRQPDGFCYATVRIAATAVEQAGLPLNCIHFVPGIAGMDIGLPNRDGSISLLLERPDSDGLIAIETANDTRQFTNGCPPLLRRHISDLDTQIRGSPVRRFKYVECGCWSHGNAILIGDAARTVPPYCGQGLNGGLHDVASLVAALGVTSHDWGPAAKMYELERREHSRRVASLTALHGRCLHDGSFGGFQWRLWDRVQRFGERVLGYRSMYQRVVFDSQFPDENSMRALLKARTSRKRDR